MVYFSDRKNAGKCNDWTVSGGDGGGADRRATGSHPPHAGAGHGSTIARSVDSGRRFVPHDRIDYEKWYSGTLGAFVWLVQEVFIIAAGVICVQTVVTAVVKLQRSRRHTESSNDQG